MTRLRRITAIAALFMTCLCVAAPAAGSALATLPRFWQDDRARAFDLRAFEGQPLILTMAYASCHRICPMTIMRLLALQRRCDELHMEAVFIIVGYDPQNDDPNAWQQYRRRRHLLRSNWHFLTGPAPQVAQFAHHLGFDFWKADQHVLHESRVVYLDGSGLQLVDPEPSQLLPDNHPQS